MRTLSWTAALGACALTVQAGVSYAHSIGDTQATEATVWEAPLPANIQAQYPSPDAAVRHVIDQYKVWKTGTVLSVCFFGGDPQFEALRGRGRPGVDPARELADRLRRGCKPARLPSVSTIPHSHQLHPCRQLVLCQARISFVFT